MTKLTPIKRTELINRLKRFGYNGPYAGGKHLYMIKGKLRITIPNPHKKEIGIDLLSRILRQAGISKKDWISSK